MSGQKEGGHGKDALADYMRALNKLNGSKDAPATTDKESSAKAGAPHDGGTGAANQPLDPAGDDTMSQYLQALERAKGNPKKGPGDGPAVKAQGAPQRQAVLKAARSAQETRSTAPQTPSAEVPVRKAGVLRRGLERLQDRGNRAKPARQKMTPRRVPADPALMPAAPLAAEPEAPLAPKPAAPKPVAPPPKVKSKVGRKFKPSFKAKSGKAVSRGGKSAVPFNASPTSIKLGALLLSLVAGLLLQRLVYHLGEMPFALYDFGIGAAVVVPVLLILLLVKPETRSDWTALLASTTAIGVTGGLGIALGVSLLHANALAMNEAAYPIQLLVHLVILAVLWGPVFLTVAGLLHRMELLKLSDPLKS